MFHRIPGDTGAAFVVIQHLSPDHKSMMAALLARHTPMEVVTATDGMELKPNRVHLIPPGSILRLEKNLLTLAPKIPRILSLPIDEFLNSAAHSRGAKTVAVILSGTGTDGTRGAAAIHEAGGLLVAQSPQDARFDGMPASVIATGLVDRVLPADELGLWISAILSRGAPPRLPDQVEAELIEEGEDDPLYDILRVLGAASAIQFGDYKPGTIRRRIERRMLLRHAVDLAHYRDQVLKDPGEIEALRHEILVSVTSFFRDPESFRALATEIDALVREAHAERRPLRIWSVATATGEEAYSLAMFALESCARQQIWPGIKVFATDVSGPNVEMASAGSFPESIVAEMAPDLVDRYFILRQGRLNVRPELRQCMVFARHNALVDPPFTRIDLVSCRNMLIYLRPSAQDRVLTRIQYALRPGGVLFLGSSEMIGAAHTAFEPLHPAHHIWRLSQLAPRPVLIGDRGLPLSRTFTRTDRFLAPTTPSFSIADQAAAVLQKAFAPPPALLLNGANEIIHSFGEVTPLVSLRPGVASLDVLRLLPEPLVPVATALLFRLRRMDDPRPQSSPYVMVPASDGKTVTVRSDRYPFQSQGSRSSTFVIL
jgi:two-component system CheB/CheR fusion protein